jgi:antitoxin (DNA-binding transcriptional repressor) of toxin-antitoxin stability system
MREVALLDPNAELLTLVAEVEASGEEIVLTRNGAPVAKLSPAAEPGRKPPRRITQADLDWLRAHRITPKPGFETPSESLQKMRDGRDW